MNRPIALCLFCAAVSGGLGCSDDTTGPESSPVTITGAVTDADGSPVVGAAILLDLTFESVDKAVMPPQTVVRFSLAEPGPLTLTVLDACRRDTFDHREMELEAGVHALPLTGTDRNGRQLTDLVAWVVVETESDTFERQILLLRNTDDDDGIYGSWDHAYVRDHVRIQAVTDDEGWFTITDPCVGFGVVFEGTDEFGEPTGDWQVPWRVRAWAFHADHAGGTPSRWRELEHDVGGTVSVILGD